MDSDDYLVDTYSEDDSDGDFLGDVYQNESWISTVIIAGSWSREEVGRTEEKVEIV